MAVTKGAGTPNWCAQLLFMHTGTQRKYVIKPINRFADGCPARRVVEKVVPLLDYYYSAPDTVIIIFSGAIEVFLCTMSIICAVCASVRLGASTITSATSPLMLTTVCV